MHQSHIDFNLLLLGSVDPFPYGAAHLAPTPWGTAINRVYPVRRGSHYSEARQALLGDYCRIAHF